MSAAEQAKGRGNAAFSAKNYDEAVKEFTSAIELDGSNAVYYSNRSMVYATMGKFEEALVDGKKCIELRPEWAKAYSRAGLALFKMNRYQEAQEIYEEGLKHAPEDANLLSGKQQCVEAGGNPFAQIFGPSMWTKLTANPATRPLLDDPAVVQKLTALQGNPQLISQYMQDEKVQQCIGTLLGIGNMFGGGNPNEHESKAAEKAPEPEPEPEPVVELSEEELKEKSIREKALEEKEAGNDLFKKKQFSEALVHYNKAREIDPKNATFVNNAATALFYMGDYDKCIEECKAAIDVIHTHGGDFKTVAKSYMRIGTAYEKLNKADDAIEAYNKSLLEARDPKVKKLLSTLEARVAKEKKDAYINPEIGAQVKAEADALFKEGKFVDAIQKYSDALKRDPGNIKILSNRAFCYTKLMDWGNGLKDCEDILAKDPTFVKAYLRKGKIQHFLKQYHKAIETYESGLKIEPNNQELKQLLAQTMFAVNSSSGGEADQQRMNEALKDPEIQAILRDPTISQVLRDLQQNPAAGQAALKDNDIRAKIEKLIAAGVLKVGNQ